MKPKSVLSFFVFNVIRGDGFGGFAKQKLLMLILSSSSRLDLFSLVISRVLVKNVLISLSLREENIRLSKEIAW